MNLNLWKIHFDLALDHSVEVLNAAIKPASLHSQARKARVELGKLDERYRDIRITPTSGGLKLAYNKVIIKDWKYEYLSWLATTEEERIFPHTLSGEDKQWLLQRNDPVEFRFDGGGFLVVRSA